MSDANTPTGSIFLTQAEAADLLRLSTRTLERYRVEGLGPKFAKLGRRVVYRRSEIDAWANARTFASTSEVAAAAA
jgi:predicted DNA-binding transcriptional regulator AlpA